MSGKNILLCLQEVRVVKGTSVSLCDVHCRPVKERDRNRDRPVSARDVGRSSRDYDRGLAGDAFAIHFIPLRNI